MNEKIRIVVADDHALLRAGVRQIVMTEDDLDLVGEASDGRDLLSKVRRLRPTVALLDVSMPKLNGFDTLPLLKEVMPELQVVMFSMHDKESYIYRALAAGAIGYVLKSDSSRELLEALRKAANGHYFLSPSLNAEVIRAFLNPNSREKPAVAGYDDLSFREQQVLRLVVAGQTSKEIAATLFISPRTVEKHRSNIFRKLGMRDTQALIRFALKLGVVDPDLWDH